MDAGVSNITFPVFWENRFQLCFEEHPFPIDLLTVKHPFVKFAFTVCIVELRVFVCVAPLFDLLECTPFHIAGSLPVKDQAVVPPFLQGCRVGRSEIERDVDTVRRITFQSHDDHVIRMGSKHFPFVMCSALFVDGCGNGV